MVILYMYHYLYTVYRPFSSIIHIHIHTHMDIPYSLHIPPLPTLKRIPRPLITPQKHRPPNPNPRNPRPNPPPKSPKSFSRNIPDNIPNPHLRTTVSPSSQHNPRLDNVQRGRETSRNGSGDTTEKGTCRCGDLMTSRSSRVLSSWWRINPSTPP